MAHALCVILVSGASSRLYAASSSVKLTLEDAQTYAIKNNQDVKALRISVDAEEARRSQVNGLFKPRIGVAGGGDFSANTDSNEATPVGYVYSTWNLFNGFQDTQKSKQGEIAVERAKSALAAAEWKVKLDVERSFYKYLFHAGQIELKDTQLEGNELHRGYVQRSRNLGNVSNVDIMEFSLVEARLNSELVAAKQELEDARSNLKRLLGEDVGEAIQPAGTLPHHHIKGSLMDYLARLEKDAPDIRLQTKALELSRAERSATDGKGLPQINFEAQAGFIDPRERLHPDKPQVSVLLLAKMDLYTGGALTSEKRERQAEVAKSEAQLRATINNAIRDAEIHYRNMRVLETRGDLEKSMVEDAERYYKSVFDEYKRGVRNSADVKNAADQVASAKLRRLELNYNWLNLKVTLEQLIGARVEIEANAI